MDDIAAKTEKDFFAARIASVQAQSKVDWSLSWKNSNFFTITLFQSSAPGKPTDVTRSVPPRISVQQEETAEDFPVVECSYDSLVEDAVDDDEVMIHLHIRLIIITCRIKYTLN